MRPRSSALAALFGAMTEPGAPLGPLCAIAALDDDLERLMKWFSTHVNRLGQTPRAAAPSVDPSALKEQAKRE